MRTLITNIQITPMGAPRMTQRDRWKKRPIVLRYWEFRDKLRAAYEDNGHDLSKMDIYEVHIEAGIPVFKSWSKKKKEQHIGQIHRKKPDSDNIEKAIMDTICKGEGKQEDSGVWYSSCKKYWVPEGMGFLEIEIKYEPIE